MLIYVLIRFYCFSVLIAARDEMPHSGGYGGGDDAGFGAGSSSGAGGRGGGSGSGGAGGGSEHGTILVELVVPDGVKGAF